MSLNRSLKSDIIESIKNRMEIYDSFPTELRNFLKDTDRDIDSLRVSVIYNQNDYNVKNTIKELRGEKINCDDILGGIFKD